MKRKLLTLWFAALAVVGCAQADEARKIPELSAKFSADYMRGDFEAMSDAYSADAVLMAPGRDVVIGKEAILEFWKTTSIPLLHKSVPDTLIIHSPSEIHDFGYFFTQRDAASPVFSAKYYIIWRRSADGEWKMYMDMWNSRHRDRAQQDPR